MLQWVKGGSSFSEEPVNGGCRTWELTTVAAKTFQMLMGDLNTAVSKKGNGRIESGTFHSAHSSSTKFLP